jgi:hypothetical protein
MHDNPNKKGAGSAEADPRPEYLHEQSSTIWETSAGARRAIRQLAADMGEDIHPMSAHPYTDERGNLAALRSILVHEQPPRCEDFWYFDAFRPVTPPYRCGSFTKDVDVVLVGSSDSPGDRELPHEQAAFRLLARSRWQHERRLAGEATADALTSATVVGSAFPEQLALDRIDWSHLRRARRVFVLPWPTDRSERLFENLEQHLLANRHVRKVRRLSWPYLHARFTAWQTLARAVQLAVEEGGIE